MIQKIRLPKDISAVVIFDILAKLIIGISSILLIRLLDVSIYATYVKFNTIASLIFGVAGVSMATTYVRAGVEYISRGKKYLKSIYKICLLFLIIIAVGIALASKTLAKGYSVGVEIIIIALGYGLLQSLNRINEGYFQIKGAFGKAGILQNIRNIIQFLTFAVLLILAVDVSDNLLFGIFYISVIIPVVIGIVQIAKREKEKDDVLEKDALQSIVKDGTILIIYMFIINMIDQVDIMLVNYMLDEHAVASYGVALKYYQLLLTLQASLSTVFRIRTSDKEIVDNQEKRAEFSKKWIKSTWVFIISILLLANLLATPLMNFLNGMEYVDSIPAFRVFVLGAAVSYLFAPNVAVMMAAKKHILLCIFATIGLVINILIDVCLIPYWGISAAALATVAGNAFLNIMSFITIQLDRRK